uniref:Uncharacterized protein n=1 Tax=Panagrolaimus davidi TaxID=227884 RepID=A0A914P9B4_9BILA
MSFMLFVHAVTVFVFIPAYYKRIDQKALYDYNIQAAMKNGLMIGCDFVVTPWYTNLCQNEDSGNAYAWRQYKLFKTDDPDCVDVYERTPCYDKPRTGLPNRTRIWKNSCPFTSMSDAGNQKYPWMKNLAILDEVSVVVKTPLISDLTPYLNQTVRGMDLFMFCPGCIYRGCGNDNGKPYPLYNKYRHGWPYNFAACTFDNSKKILCGQ